MMRGLGRDSLIFVCLATFKQVAEAGPSHENIMTFCEGQPGEQWTMFFKDPSGNALEFKAMTNPENLFAKYFVK